MQVVWISDIQKPLKSEKNCSDSVRNTEPSGTGPKVEYPRTELVRILDVDCTKTNRHCNYVNAIMSQEMKTRAENGNKPQI